MAEKKKKTEQNKRKTVKTSSLTRIDGIGPAKAKKLLAAFGTMAALRAADEAAIAAVSGIGTKDAAAVFAALHDKEDREGE